jgi:pimeloyl-ACP methyl ester carboxylesterase
VIDANEALNATPSAAGARPPEREYQITSSGVGIAIHEWGNANDPPLVLAHGGFDFARTFDTFAPILADAGWRVVCWDQRGHGDSEHAHLYSWDADMRDAAEVFEHVAGRTPVAALGHSKGGALLIQLADAQPFRIHTLINIDGLPSKRPIPDVAEHERTKMLVGELDGWLDHRRNTAGTQRKPGTIDELAARRGRQNPRLSNEWLRYLVSVGAYESADGWRWKLDASMRFGGFGPWRPEWAMMRLAGIGVPFYGMLVEIPEKMGWGTEAHEIERFIPDDGRLDTLEGVGHFAHIEQPQEVATQVIDFLSVWT